MHSDNLLQNLYSYLRLAAGSCAVFFGLAILGSQKPGELSWQGIVVGGIGLALALNETAYVGARFLAGFLKPPPPESPTEPPAQT